jgi:hypothetical protein
VLTFFESCCGFSRPKLPERISRFFVAIGTGASKYMDPAARPPISGQDNVSIFTIEMGGNILAIAGRLRSWRIGCQPVVEPAMLKKKK